jgi:hypothetical protein
MLNAKNARPFHTLGRSDFVVQARNNGSPLIVSQHGARIKIQLPPLTASSVYLGPQGNLGITKGTYKIETLEKAQYSVSFRLPAPTCKRMQDIEHTGTHMEQELSDWLHDTQENIFRDLLESDSKIMKQLVAKNKNVDDILLRREDWMVPFRMGSDGWWYLNIASSCLGYSKAVKGESGMVSSDARTPKLLRMFKVKEDKSLEETTVELHRGSVLGIVFAFSLYAVSSTVYGVRAELCTSDIKVFDEGLAVSSQMNEEVLRRDLSNITKLTLTEPKANSNASDVRTFFMTGDDGHPLVFRFPVSKASFLKGNELKDEVGGFSEGFHSVKLSCPDDVTEEEKLEYGKFEKAIIYLCREALRSIVSAGAIDPKRKQLAQQFPKYTSEQINDMLVSDASMPFKDYAEKVQFNLRTRVVLDEEEQRIRYQHKDGTDLETYSESDFACLQPVARIQGYVRDGGKRMGLSLKWVLKYPTVVSSMHTENEQYIAETFFGFSEEEHALTISGQQAADEYMEAVETCKHESEIEHLNEVEYSEPNASDLQHAASDTDTEHGQDNVAEMESSENDDAMSEKEEIVSESEICVPALVEAGKHIRNETSQKLIQRSVTEYTSNQTSGSKSGRLLKPKKKAVESSSSRHGNNVDDDEPKSSLKRKQSSGPGSVLKKKMR